MVKWLASSLYGDKMFNLNDAKRIQFVASRSIDNTDSSLTIKGIDDSDEQSAIATIFGSGSWTGNEWDYIEKLFSAIASRMGFDINGVGILFPEEAEDWEVQQGIKLFTPVGEIELTEEAFNFVALKYFKAVYDKILVSSDKGVRSSWGNKLAEYVKNAS